MMTFLLVSAISLFVLVVVIPLTVVLLEKFAERAKKRKAIAGAAFWLTSFWLCVVFVFIGIGWGLCVGLLKM